MGRNPFPIDVLNPLKVINKAVYTVPVTVNCMTADLENHFQLVIEISISCIPKLCGVLFTHNAPPEYGHSTGMKDSCNRRKNLAQI